MDPLSTSAASGLRARMESLDMLANNLANASTSGYKTDREFYSLYVSDASAGGADSPSAPTLPVVESHWTDFTQGVLTPTGNPLDLALSGQGFFAVNGPSGALYTRNGSFNVSSAGQVVTADGYPVRLQGGGTLQADASRPVEVAADGTVSQEGQVLGGLELVSFKDPAALSKVGSNYFRPLDASLKPAPAASAAVHQGKLEGSNVGSAEAAVRLVSIMRQFEMLQKAIALGAEMNRKAVEEVARVGS